MTYLLDTSSCITFLRGGSSALPNKIRQQTRGSVAISTITVAELEYGVAGSDRTEEERAQTHNFLGPFRIVPFDREAAIQYGSVKSALRQKGIGIGPLDTLLAAHALSLSAVMVTENVREFRRVPGLIVEDWTN